MLHKYKQKISNTLSYNSNMDWLQSIYHGRPSLGVYYVAMATAGKVPLLCLFVCYHGNVM